jgi:hypothetical protein
VACLYLPFLVHIILAVGAGDDEANTEENLVSLDVHADGVGSQGEPSGQASQNDDHELEALEQTERYDTFPTHEPNFLPPFANAENKSLNKNVQVSPVMDVTMVAINPRFHTATPAG